METMHRETVATVPTTGDGRRRKGRLLACGVVAGPLFVAVALLQAVTRDGFSLADHAPSFLSVGDLGWVQIANFVVCGALFVVASIGLRRTLPAGRGSKWGPRLMGVFGVSLILGGVFVADPAYGFPPGTPPGRPDGASWHAHIHAGAAAIGFTALVVATFVLARRFLAAGDRGWAAYSIVTGIGVELLSGWTNASVDEGVFLPLWVAVVAGFAWASLMFAKLARTAP